MDFNKELSYRHYMESLGEELDYPQLGRNCIEETYYNLNDFLEADYEYVLSYEKKQYKLNKISYELKYKALEDVSIKEYFLVKWNKLWRRKQITT